jgi:hypothetical protein
VSNDDSPKNLITKWQCNGCEESWPFDLDGSLAAARHHFESGGHTIHSEREGSTADEDAGHIIPDDQDLE